MAPDSKKDDGRSGRLGASSPDIISRHWVVVCPLSSVGGTYFLFSSFRIMTKKKLTDIVLLMVPKRINFQLPLHSFVSATIARVGSTYN